MGKRMKDIARGMHNEMERELRKWDPKKTRQVRLKLEIQILETTGDAARLRA